LLYFCASASLLTLPSRAQGAQQNSQPVAEAARQEKARQAAQQKKDSHVYTNEDLKQSQILTPQDRSRVEARKNNPAAAPGKPAAPAVNAEKNSAPESLGEVARRYRRQQLENSQAAEAAKRLPQSRFPMELSQPSYAAPAKPVAPIVAPGSHPRQTVKPLPRNAPSRRDPFSHQIFSPLLPGERAPLSPNLSAPPKPAISFSDAAPHAPAVRAAPPAAAAKLLLPGERAPLSPNLSAPPKPAISFSDAAPHAPAVRAAPPAAAPKLLLPGKPLPAAPSLVPRAVPVAPIENKISGARQIQVQPGDSLWRLARRHLGNGSRWSDLLASNPGISDPNHIQPGTVLVVPASDLRPRVQPSSITIRSGDSLWKLAASRLGSGAAWPCIAQANPQLRDPNHLRPGQLLVLPTSCPTQLHP